MPDREIEKMVRDLQTIMEGREQLTAPQIAERLVQLGWMRDVEMVLKLVHNGHTQFIRQAVRVGQPEVQLRHKTLFSDACVYIQVDRRRP
jgi:hypothetical protein